MCGDRLVAPKGCRTCFVACWRALLQVSRQLTTRLTETSPAEVLGPRRRPRFRLERIPSRTGVCRVRSSPRPVAPKKKYLFRAGRLPPPAISRRRCFPSDSLSCCWPARNIGAANVHQNTMRAAVFLPGWRVLASSGERLTGLQSDGRKFFLHALPASAASASLSPRMDFV